MEIPPLLVVPFIYPFAPGEHKRKGKGGKPRGQRQKDQQNLKQPPRILSRVLKKWCSCFDELSTNGQCSMFSRPPPFALSLSKGEWRVFQQPVRAGCNCLCPLCRGDPCDRP